MLSRLAAVLLIIVLSPVLLILSAGVWIWSGWPVIFVQKRRGKKGQDFWMYKFRTMRVGAEKEREKYLSKNEADGPVFKIRDDPRFTGIGAFLSHTGWDELPQLFNVLGGEMALIGPRPLPVAEAEKIGESYRRVRESIMPGIISPWIFGGYHLLSFEEWMQSDMEYAKRKTVIYDIELLIRSGYFVGRLLFWEIFDLLTKIFKNGLLFYYQVSRRTDKRRK